MRIPTFAVAAACSLVPVLALSPVAALATTVTPLPANQATIFYDNVDSSVALGDFDLAAGNVAVQGLFDPAAGDVAGSLGFGVFSSSPASGVAGSIDINIIADGTTFSGTFDGSPLVFTQIDNDFVASFEAALSGPGDIKQFFLSFSGLDAGDQVQVNAHAVSAVPLPASLTLLIGAFGALGGLGFLRRRESTPMAV